MEKKRNLWVIPTDKPSRILFDKEENRLLPLQDSTVFMQYQDLVENQHIYITNDEEIKEGDYVISTYDKWRGDGKLKPQIGEMLEIHNDYYLIDSFNGDTNNRWDKGHSKKIILTTDKDLDGIQAIDDEFLNWFVKNPSCEKIEVKSESSRKHGMWKPEYYPQIYKIIIPKEEPKETIYYCKQGINSIKNKYYGINSKRTKTNKMTALQTLIEQLRKKLDTFPDDMNLSQRGLYDGYLNAINMANALIGEDKQQIVDAYTNGQIDIANLLFEVLKENGFKGAIPLLENDNEDGIKYYNQLVNKEK